MIRVKRPHAAPFPLAGEFSRGWRERTRVVRFWQTIESALQILDDTPTESRKLRDDAYQKLEDLSESSVSLYTLRKAEGSADWPTATSKYRDDALAVLSKKFAAYSDPSVKKSLVEVFHGKCAYCESYIYGSQPMDVEHWRPKSAILNEETGAVIRPGYYWLASEWSNLLLSCSDCNRERWQDIASKGDHVERSKTGKGVRFPLEDETSRARHPLGDLKENPLLLDPCGEDDPADHLEFHCPFSDPRDDLLIQAAVVRARVNGDSESPKGTVSIEVLGLNRVGLVQDRRELLLELLERLFGLLWMARNIEAAVSDEERSRSVNIFTFHLRSALRMCSPERRFSQMARQVLDAFMRLICKR